MAWVVKCKIAATTPINPYPEWPNKEHVQILQYLSEPEALSFVISSCIDVVNVRDPRETCGGVEICSEALDSTPGAIQIDLVSGYTPRIEVTFQDLRALNIIRSSDIVSVQVIKL
jgi:hypothetical protein